MMGYCVYCGALEALDRHGLVEHHLYVDGRCPGALLPPRQDALARDAATPRSLDVIPCACCGGTGVERSQEAGIRDADEEIARGDE